MQGRIGGRKEGGREGEGGREVEDITMFPKSRNLNYHTYLRREGGNGEGVSMSPRFKNATII